MWWKIVWGGETVFWQQLRLKVAAMPKFSCTWKRKMCDESAPKLSIPSLQMLSSSIFAFSSSFEGAYLGWQLWSGKFLSGENAILTHHSNLVELFFLSIHLICLFSLFNSLIMDGAIGKWAIFYNTHTITHLDACFRVWLLISVCGQNISPIRDLHQFKKCLTLCTRKNRGTSFLGWQR